MLLSSLVLTVEVLVRNGFDSVSSAIQSGLIGFGVRVNRYRNTVHIRVKFGALRSGFQDPRRKERLQITAKQT